MDEISAFPGPAQSEQTMDINEGMSLRDYFAAKAIQAILPIRQSILPIDRSVSDEHWRVGVALDCYAMADAMLIARNALVTASPAEPAQPVTWNALTDEDRQRAMQSMPDMLDGFMKTWGWLHFANAIEAICREKNEANE